MIRPGLPWWQALFLSRSVQHRIAVGGQYGPLVPVDPWRLCTGVLLHVDALHLILNATALWTLGQLLEARLGAVRWTAWFAICGFAGALCSQWAGVRQSDGASGGAFGLLGAALVLGWRWRRSLSADERWIHGPVLGGFLALNLVASFVIPSINPIAHVGGLAAGLVLAVLPDHPWIRAAEALALGGFVGACAYGWILG